MVQGDAGAEGDDDDARSQSKHNASRISQPGRTSPTQIQNRRITANCTMNAPSSLAIAPTKVPATMAFCLQLTLVPRLRLALLRRHLPPLSQVRLIPHKQDEHVRAAFSPYVLYPV